MNLFVTETVALEIHQYLTALRALNSFLRKNKNTKTLVMHAFVRVCVLIHLQTRNVFLLPQYKGYSET